VRVWLLLPTLAVVAQADSVDRVVAVVAGELVLQSDVAMDALLDPVDKSPSPYWANTPADRATRLADAALLRHRAGDLAIYQPSRDDVAKRLAAIEAAHPDLNDQVKRLGYDRSMLENALKRRMIVERFLERDLVVQRTGPDAWQDALTALLARERAAGLIRWVPAMEHP